MAAGLEDPDHVRKDLLDLAICLRIAREQNAQFRFEVG